MKSTIKTALKHFHRHNTLLPDVYIFTLPRTGSTLLAEILNVNSGGKVCSEPFALNKENKKVLKHYFPADFLADRYLDLDNQQLNNVLVYLKELSAGKTWNSFYWSDFPGKDHSFKTKYTIFKLHKLTYLIEEIMQNLQGSGLYMIRHPVSHSLSRLRNGWDTYNQQFLASEKIKNSISEQAAEKAKQVMQSGSTLDKFVLSWCLENYVFLKKEKQNNLPNNLFLLTYEKLINNPEQSINELCKKLNIPFQERMLEKINLPSHGIVHSTDDTKARIRRGESKQLLDKWRQKISISEEESAFSILDAFGIDLYRKGDNLPVC